MVQRQDPVLAHHLDQGLQVVEALFYEQLAVLTQTQLREPSLEISRDTLLEDQIVGYYPQCLLAL